MRPPGTSGSRTTLPEPRRVRMKPWSRNSAYALVTVVRLTPTGVVSSRSAGSLVP